MEAFVMFSLIGAIAVAIGVTVFRAAAARREACRAIARQMSLEFRLDFPELVADLSSTGLLPYGTSYRVRNALVGTRGSLRVALADLSYRSGSGSSRQSHSESICVLRRPDLGLARFVVQTRSPLGDLLRAGGEADDGFADDPAFSRSFQLQGGNDVAAQLFGPEVRSHLLQLTDRPVRIAGGGEALILSHRPLTPPAELPTLLAKSTELLELLSSAQALP